MHDHTSYEGLLGSLFDEIQRGASAADVLAELNDLFGEEPLTVAFVGPTSAGKTTLLNALFGEEVGAVALAADTTEHLFVVELPSGLRLVDTPGTSGKEENEGIVAAYLGVAGTGEAVPRAVPTTWHLDGASVQRSLASDELDSLRPNLVFFCVPPKGTHGPDDVLLEQTVAAGYDCLLVVTQEGRYRADFDMGWRGVRRRARGLGLQALASDARTGNGMDALVTEALRRVPVASLERLNAAFDRRHRQDARRAKNAFLRRVGARGACIVASDDAAVRAAALARVAVRKVCPDTTVDVNAEDLGARMAPSTITLPDSVTPKETDKLKEYVLLLPRLVKLLYRLLRDPRVPPKEKVILGLTIAYVVNPLDLIADAIPYVGQLDDALLMAVALLRLVNQSGWDIVLEYWEGDREVLWMFVSKGPEALLKAIPHPVAVKLIEMIGIDPSTPPPPPETDPSTSHELPAHRLGADFVRLLYQSAAMAGGMGTAIVDTFLDEHGPRVDELADRGDVDGILDLLQALELSL